MFRGCEFCGVNVVKCCVEGVDTAGGKEAEGV